MQSLKHSKDIQIQHFILTRFNIKLWNKDKNRQSVRSEEWLNQRFEVFEKFCLPSVANQTCKSFEWLVLFDSETPIKYKQRIATLKEKCPQLTSIYVKPEYGRYFRQIFKEEVVKRLNTERVITTYLDNDDALNLKFVEDLQERTKNLEDGTFICYPDGVQYFTDMKMLLRIRYLTNHFISIVEANSVDTFKTIYGYGSHAYINKIPSVKIEYVNDSLQWCEVVHDRNMENDAFFLLGAKMIKDHGLLKKEFGVDEQSESSLSLYICRFIPRYIKTFVRRIGYFLFGRRW